MFARFARGSLRHWPHALVLIILMLLVLSGLQGWLRERLLDARFEIVQRAPTGRIVLVEIDPRSIDGMGAWPWPRTAHADLVRKLREAGALDIAFDVDFSAPSIPANDAAFAQALQDEGGSVILASFRQRTAEGGIHENKPIPSLAEAAWPGVVNVAPDPDGAIRRYHTTAFDGTTPQPSLAALLAGEQMDRGAFRIDYGIRRSELLRVSYIDVLRGDPAALDSVRGRKAIVSGTAIELGDRFVVPGGKIIPGSVIQALATESLMQDRALSLTGWPAGAAGVLALSLLLGFAWRRVRPGARCLIVLAAAALAEAMAVALQTWRPIAADTSLILAACPAYILAIGLDHFDLQTRLRSAAEKRFQRIATSLSDGLACLDETGRITFWNPGASAIFGYSESEMRAAPFATLLESGAPLADSADPLQALSEAAGQVVETRGRRKTGESFHLEASFSQWRALGAVHFGVVLRDITRRKRDEERIRYLATFDPLTGAANRYSLLARLEENLTPEPSSERAGLVLVAINHFEQISNLQGRYTGDALLCAMAQRLSALVEDGDLIARLDGPEFAVFLPASSQGGRTLSFADRLATEMDANKVLSQRLNQRVSVSVAAALAGSAATADEWLGNAQLALAKARTSAATRAVRYRSSMREEITQRAGLEDNLRRALEKREFELFYQPQVDLATRRIIGAEALIRWNDPSRGLVSPSDFMNVVNTTSISESVGDWVLEAAFLQAARWNARGRGIRIGVNLCQTQMSSRGLATKIARLLHATGAPAELIEFEVTEDIILDLDGHAKTALAKIREMGASVAFDDFGTGYGSLSYLKSFPIDRIKIDQSFVRALQPGTEDSAIVQAVLDLSRAFDLSAIAEGVECEDTARLLTDMGCAEGQGYWFGKPMAADDLGALLEADAELSRAS